MIDHISIGCNKIKKAKEFYNKILPLFGFESNYEDRNCIGYKPKKGPKLWIVIPIDESKLFGPSNGFHICFKAQTRELVEQFYKEAIAAGGTCDGPPGIREIYGSNYYAAYILDLEGNKLEAANY